jgi:hypothetical protein
VHNPVGGKKARGSKAKKSKFDFSHTFADHGVTDDDYALYFKLNAMEFVLTGGKEEPAGESLPLKAKLALFFHNFVAKLEGIMKEIEGALDLFKKWPQAGFKITADLAFLSGDLFVGLAHFPLDSTQPYAGPLKDRYVPLLHNLHVESKLSLVKFDVEASFGLKVDGGSVGMIEARVVGSTGIELMLQIFVDLIIGPGAENGKDWDVLSEQLTAQSKSSLRATVEVKVAVFSFKREIGIETGVAIDGRIRWGFMKNEILYALKVRTLETGWYFYTTDVATSASGVSVHKIFAARDIFPECSTTVKLQ